MINQETKLPYANTDPSLHFNHSEPTKPDWRREYVRLLKIRDYEAAERLKAQNMISDECDAGEHDACFFSWCCCSHHSAVQFRLEHPELQSLSSVQSTREESEAT